MYALTLALSALLVGQNPEDPEPPKPGPIGVRLVAKKAKYKLDLGGRKKEDYVREASVGRIQAPKVELWLEFTNHTRGNVCIRLAEVSKQLGLTLKGPGAIEGTSSKDVCILSVPSTTLKPGQKMTIILDRLADIEPFKAFFLPSSVKCHYWTEPGKYTLSATFSAMVTLDSDGKTPKTIAQKLASKPITLEVEK